MPDGMMGPGIMGLMWLWGLLGLVFVLAMVAVVAWAVNRHPREETLQDRALAILKERYARGEISREEYLAAKRDLAA